MKPRNYVVQAMIKNRKCSTIHEKPKKVERRYGKQNLNKQLKKGLDVFICAI